MARVPEIVARLHVNMEFRAPLTRLRKRSAMSGVTALAMAQSGRFEYMPWGSTQAEAKFPCLLPIPIALF